LDVIIVLGSAFLTTFTSQVSNEPRSADIKMNSVTKRLPEMERQNFNHAVFSLAFFSQPQDQELLGAIFRGLPDCPCRV
jgi:hypothetical protein